MLGRDDSDTAVLMVVPKDTGVEVEGTEDVAVPRMDVDEEEEVHIGNETGSLIKGAAGMGIGSRETDDGKGGKADLVNREQPEMGMPVPESPLHVTMGFRLDGPGELPDFAYY